MPTKTWVWTTTVVGKTAGIASVIAGAKAGMTVVVVVLATGMIAEGALIAMIVVTHALATETAVATDRTGVVSEIVHALATVMTGSVHLAHGMVAVATDQDVMAILIKTTNVSLVSGKLI